MTGGGLGQKPCLTFLLADFWLKIPKGKHTRFGGWKLTSNKWVFFLRAAPNWNVVNCRPPQKHLAHYLWLRGWLGSDVCAVCVGHGTGRQSETLISRWAVEEIAEKLLVDYTLSLSVFYSVCLSFFQLKVSIARRGIICCVLFQSVFNLTACYLCLLALHNIWTTTTIMGVYRSDNLVTVYHTYSIYKNFCLSTRN